MHARPRLSATAAAILVLLAAAPAARAGTLKGRLAFPDGKPAAGVVVKALPFEEPHDEALREARRAPAPAPLATATAGSDGRFALSVAQPDARFVLETEGGGAVAAVAIRFDGVFDAAESEELPEATLARGEALAGKVVDEAGAPVAGAEVVLEPGATRVLFGGGAPERVPRRAATGADGSFRFDGAAADANVLSAEKEGFAPVRVAGVRPGAPRTLVLRAGTPLAGTVLLPDRRTGAKGALVRYQGAAGTRWVETGEDGRFAIAHVPAGAGRLIVDAATAGFAEVAALSVPRRDDKPLVAILAPPSSLAGRVVDAKTLRPLPRVKVVARGALGARVARSGPDGRYRIAPLAPGPLSLRADDARYVAWEKDALTLGRGEAKALDVVLTPGATLAGRVVDESGRPVADAKGSLERGGQSGLQAMLRRARGSGAPAFRTAADGSFRASRLAPGDGQKLTVSHPDFESGAAAGLALPPGGVKAGVTVVLKRGASVTGRVHDADGNPVAGAEVALEREAAMRAGRRGLNAAFSFVGGGDRTPVTTGPDGRFALRGVPPGEWSVAVSGKGWARETVGPVKVSEERPPAPLDVTLVPAVAIAGVMRSKAGTPLAGYMVSARPSGTGLGSPGGINVPEPTGPDGLFVLDGLKAGQSYDLMAFGGGGFLPLQKNRVVAPASDVEFVATGAGRITGRAVDEKSGAPLTDFTVSTEPDMMGGRMVRMAIRSAGRVARGLTPTAVVHDEDGAFTLEDVAAGTWSVVVEAKGYQTARVGGVTVEEGATKENVEVRASAGGTLKGRVLDGSSGRGVPEVTVSAGPVSGGMPSLVTIGLDDGSGVTTDADGKFEIDGLAPGRYRVAARHPDYAEASETAEVKETGGTVDLRLTAGGVLGGAVLSAGQPVPGADVTLTEEGEGGISPRGMGFGGQTATTDAGGRFRFEHLTAGRFSVSAGLRSRTSQAANVVLAAGETKEDVVLSLSAGTSIHGVVTGLPDEQRAGVYVSASGDGGWSASSRTAADGTFTLDGAPAGAVILTARAGDMQSSRSASKQVVVDDAQPVLETEIAFDAGYTLSGRVTKAGRPVAGANVNVNQSGSTRTGSCRTDDSGTYRVDGLAAGTTHVVVFGGPIGGAAKTKTLEMAGDQTLDVDFSTARIGGTVVESGSRRPLADASVDLAAAASAGADAPSIRRTYRTDSNGRFSSEDLDPATYTLTVQKPDYLFEKRDVAASEQGTDDLVVELTRGEGIGIDVLDGIYRIPLKGVFVRVTDAAQRPVFSSPVSLDAQGHGEVPSLKPGVYALWMDADGYAPVTIDSVTVPSSSLAVSMTPGGAVEVHAGPKTLASGSVTLQFLTAAGQPYRMGVFGGQGAVVLAVPLRRFENFAPGGYTVNAGAAGTQPFQVAEGRTTVVTLP